MPRFTFRIYEEATYIVEFEADDLEHAKKLVAEAEENMQDHESLPDSEKYWKKGQEEWDTESLEEQPIVEL